MAVITTPTIHLNGSSAESLREDYLNAYRAVNAAYDALVKCNPNARDYYVAPGTLHKAIHEQVERQNALTKIAEELSDLMTHCDSHCKA